MEKVLARWKTLRSNSWFWYIILLIPLLFLAAWVCFKFFLYESEIMKLKTKVEQDEERKKNLATQARIAKVEEEKREVQKEIFNLGEQIKAEKIHLKEVEDAHKKRLEEIDGASSFGELLGLWGS